MWTLWRSTLEAADALVQDVSRFFVAFKAYRLQSLSPGPRSQLVRCEEKVACHVN
jgi:hypothetical protein